MSTHITRTSSDFPFAVLTGGSLTCRFLPGGALYDMTADGIRLNSYSGTPLDLPVANLYLRRHTEQGIRTLPLLGPSRSVETGENVLRARRTDEGVETTLTVKPGKGEELFWIVDIANHGQENVKMDAVFYFPVGLASDGALLCNESYISQYVDHTILKDEKSGPVLCSRQNLAQNGKHPWLLSTVLSGGYGFLTDGFDFYGLSARKDGAAAACSGEIIGHSKRQYECACHALQSVPQEIAPGNRIRIVFYQHYCSDHAQETSESDLRLLNGIKLPTANSSHGKPFSAEPTLFASAEPLAGDELTGQEIRELYPEEHRHEEFPEGKTGSFFYGRSTHVVFPAKELRTLRTHGHILRADSTLYPGREAASVTVWMNGVFNSHFAFGNVGFQMGTGIQRGMLNFLRSGGTRAFLKTGGKWRLLGVPSVFEMDLNRCRWIYDIRGLRLQVVCESLDSRNAFRLRFESDQAVELLVSTELLFGGSEFSQALPVERNEKEAWIRVSPGAGSPAAEAAPDAVWQLNSETPVQIGGAELLGGCPEDPFAVIRSTGRNLTLFFCGRENANDLPSAEALKNERPDFNFWEQLCRHAAFRSRESGKLAPLADILPWFVHNALIHFATPYGLEQFMGAAWGVRDVCQGPVELFLALNRPDAVRDILRKVFEHQYENGTWPQWFMFDGYHRIQQRESHGDIPVWPLKAVCDYLEYTEDYAVLETPLCYTAEDGTFTRTVHTLREHMQRTLNYIRENVVPGTRLLCYGDGDWNDSLQPAHPELKRSMVSSWTVELLIQTLRRWSHCEERRACRSGQEELSALADAVESDFRKYLIRDGVVAGFGIRRPDGNFDLLLHPSDRETGIHYRLLPSTRGILSECFSAEEAETHLEIIRNHLLLADGAHLMDAPPRYRGGKNRFFQRAETSAFFGREIGLNYTHAHIRYLEAMAKLGEANAMFRGFLTACPAALSKTVFQADFRQSNAYFSSSDCEASDRYEIQDHYHEVRNGSRKVNGGWRIYSSGPGMYVSMLITRFFGLRKSFGNLVIDPVIPADLGDVELKLDFEGSTLTVRYTRHAGEALRLNGEPLIPDGREANPYRRGGMLISYDAFTARLKADNILEVKL